MTNTVRDLPGNDSSEKIAFSAPGRPSLTYGGLVELVEKTVADLNARGIGRNDRVAIVLPNGPEMATCFIAVAGGATTAPLNPNYREEEFNFYLPDLNAKALIVEKGSQSPAVAAANNRDIPILEISWEDSDPAGSFTLGGTAGTPAANGGMAGPDDVALILHTSGTTSRPKIVPLSQTNVTATAANVAASTKLTAEDRCMNIMPLFHIHGLMAAVLGSMAAKASVFCTPGFNAMKVFAWMDEAKPTWYTAVPTMHQAILARAPRNKEIVERINLRFVRSSSSSLPPQVMKEVEELFDAPLIEAYGMTEAAHQMACNELPPGKRKAGTVGPGAGPEVAVMDDDGNLLGVGQIGELVIRGPNVFTGYEANPEANATAFTNGWFRTGDQGTVDEDGFFALTGRLKEIINRGGEKISPREVDETIMDHPAVKQVVVFAVPHDKLGEEVAAAVVLRDGMEATEREIRDFVSARLVDFKVPRKVLFVDAIPLGATGKLQRIGLAEKLGLA